MGIGFNMEESDILEEPVVRLLQWKFMVAHGGTIHLVGFKESGKIRSSSAVVSIDGSTVTTESGRIYHLIGDECVDPTEIILNLKREGIEYCAVMTRINDKTPTAKYVRELAQEHGVVYVSNGLDRLANVFTRLSGDDVALDSTGLLLVALVRADKISDVEMLKLLGDHLRELTG